MPILALFKLFTPMIVYAQTSPRSISDMLKNGIIPEPGPSGSYEISDVFIFLAGILRLIFVASSIIAVIYIIIGGYYYVTAYGNPESAEKGKSTITWAIMGLVISIAAFAIVQFVWNRLSGQTAPSPTNVNPAVGP